MPAAGLNSQHESMTQHFDAFQLPADANDNDQDAFVEIDLLVCK